MEFGVLKKEVILYTDSQSPIHLGRNYVFQEMSKHVKVKYHFIQDLFEQKEFMLENIPSEGNPADMGTNIVTLHKFNTCK